MIIIPVKYQQQGGKITLKVNVSEQGLWLLDRPSQLSQMFLHSAFCLYIWSNSSLSCRPFLPAQKPSCLISPMPEITPIITMDCRVDIIVCDAD